jgi:hypothetical protein
VDWCAGVAMAKELPGVLGVSGWVGIQCATVFALVIVSLVFIRKEGNANTRLRF